MSFSNTDTGSKPQDPYKEKNKDETSLREKIEDLVAFMEKCKFAMMTTRIDSSGLLVSRCMALAAKVQPISSPFPLHTTNPLLQESGGIDLLFHTNTESGKTDDLKSDPVTNIAFLNSSGEWASISGKATISTDRSLVHKHYSPSLKAWMGDLGDGKHDGGPDDPRIGIIWVKAVTATYAITNQSFMSRGFEIAKGTVTGEAAKVNKLREVSKEELAECELRSLLSPSPLYLNCYGKLRKELKLTPVLPSRAQNPHQVAPPTTPSKSWNRQNHLCPWLTKTYNIA
jgi:general stress protein 26